MGRINFGKAPLVKTQGAIKETDKRDILWENVDLSIYDVVRMNDDDFTRLSAIPNFGNIRVEGKECSINLATAIKYYNLDLYNKYKLLLDDYEEDDGLFNNEEEDDNGIEYSSMMKNRFKYHMNKYKPSFLETYESEEE